MCSICCTSHSMARGRLAAGLLLCVALALTASVRAEEAEAVITVTDGDSFDKLIKVRRYMLHFSRRRRLWRRSRAR